MSKTTKKTLTITGIVIGAIIALMIIIPFFFKGKIKDTVINLANENLNAKVAIGDFGLNLFSNFPQATLNLEDVSVVGIDKFENDTLVKAKTASVTIDLFSLFGDNYKIGKIIIDNTTLYAKVLEDGSPNWNIVKSDEGEQIDDSSSDSAFKLDLDKIEVKNINIIYEDLSSNMKAEVLGWHGEISGDFSASETTLKTKSVIDQLTVAMAGIPYLNKVKATANAQVNANFDEMKFTFADSQVFLNDLEAGIDGWFAFLDNEEGYDFDLKLNAPKADFKQVLSLVPAMYTADFKDVNTAGEVTLDAYIVGKMTEEILPAFNLRLEVSNAMFKYPSLPKSVDDINLLLQVNGDGGSLDNMMILVDKFGFKMGGNPFKGSFRMTPAVNDKSIKFYAEGKLDLSMIPEVYPMEEGTNLKGNLDADVRVSTTWSAIEKEQYENVSADGHINLNQFELKTEGLPDVLINTGNLAFTPRYVNLSALDLTIGKSDLKANGRLENFIGYLLKDQTLKGNLDIKSTYLDLDELIGNSEDEAEEVEEPTESVAIPKNIDFVLNATFAHLVFNQVDITNASGGITVKDGILSMNNLTASALGGLANVSGKYDTSDPKDPKVDFDMALTKISFTETFKHIETVQKFAPIFEDILGTYSMNLKLNTKLGATFTETLAGLSAAGALLTNNISMEGNKTLSALGSALKTDKLDKLSTKDLNLPFSIENGALKTQPFSFNFGEGGQMTLEGVTKLDQSIDYKGTIKLPASLDNKVVSQIPITIGGTFKDPKIGVDVKSAINNAVGSAVDKLLGGKTEDGESTDLSTKVNEEKAKQIAKIREEADKAATALVETAKKAATEAEEKASNPLAKAAAKKLGEEGVKKAEKEAQKLRDKAEEQIKKLEGESEAVNTEE